eukprot:CAMPEP_0202857698 /NCGR_PEP_ID=MMETSP1391-20130828/540_1 /ASSEMBLY_ACC=CAM_ASM_000867 /TAXON_ID=1034604 /ORGANISM="Chlamydomonas leiostraca, Strain SAG 11-49" /LENGTH=171 /DNA_ID=CAMNT_0049536537 /DNA_START=91 /DNA_END=602 /DNA_ORIENTATION=-
MADAKEEVQPTEVVEAKEEAKEEVKEEVADGAETQTETQTPGKRGSSEPVTLGYASFKTIQELAGFCRTILQNSALNVDLNEYEYLTLLALLKHHPDKDRKLGLGVRAFQVRPFRGAGGDGEARAFHALRKDGSWEDFSYLKCAAEVFPSQAGQLASVKRQRSDSGPRSGG